MTTAEVRQLYRTSPRSARLMRLITLAGINLGKAIYGHPTRIGKATHRNDRHRMLVRAYAEEHAREALAHAKEMVS